MKELTDFVIMQDDKFWIDTECDCLYDRYVGDGEFVANPPFEVNVPFKFIHDGVDYVGVVECDDGVDEFAMIPFEVVE